ncbi:MAG: DUF4240 domain-containing protein [Deltaproteobacteria bacterium]|nr:DUF4240 domain-containing protein [Deltaproteobacteria bacterium]
MPDDEFWALIDQLDWSREGDDDAVLEPVVRALAKRTVVDIKAFAETLAHKLFQLDTCAHAKEIGEDAWKDEDAFFSVDTFLYARCAVVANGREVYERALAAPEEMPKDVEFEALLYLAGSAYERRTGKELDYSTGCDFETFSNRKGWA